MASRLSVVYGGAGQPRDVGDGGEAVWRRARWRAVPALMKERNETIRLPSFNRNDFIASQEPSKSCWRLAVPASAATFQ